MAYAERTTVPVERSMNELSWLLRKHGATGFAFGTDHDDGMTRAQFKLSGRIYRFDVPMADWREFRKMRNGQWRTEDQARKFAEGEDRRRWRSLVLVVKAILVAIEDGVGSAQDLLLGFTVLPDGTALRSWIAPQLEASYSHHRMPALLPGAPIALEGKS